MKEIETKKQNILTKNLEVSRGDQLKETVKPSKSSIFKKKIKNIRNEMLTDSTIGFDNIGTDDELI